MKITKVLGSRVLIKLLDAVKEEEDGIAVAPTSINPGYFTGEVIGIGPMVAAFLVNEATNETKTAVQIGDKVAFVKYGFEDMGDGQYIVEENGILCVFQ